MLWYNNGQLFFATIFNFIKEETLMKKALSLALALMMLISMICAIPVMADEPDGSQANPYYVTNPMTAPGFITIPANSTLYYQYNVMVFNGWSVEAYGLSAITVDGVTYDQPDMWGNISVDFQFNFMSPGIVGYTNGTARQDCPKSPQARCGTT